MPLLQRVPRLFASRFAPSLLPRKLDALFGVKKTSIPRCPHRADRRPWISNLRPNPQARRSRTKSEGARHAVTSQRSALDEHRLEELYRGEFPADVYEGVYYVKTTFREYRLIRDAFADDKKRARVSYNAHLSTTAVRRVSPTFFHQDLIRAVGQALQGQLLQGSVQTTTAPLTLGRTADLFLLHHQGETMIPDPVLALEVGLSQPYRSLLSTTKLHLEQTDTINVSLLINVREHPYYHTPLKRRITTPTSELKTVATHLRRVGGQFHSFNEIAKQCAYEVPQDTESPVVFKDVKWVGRMEATLEIWTRDQQTGLPVRKNDPILFYGRHVKIDSENPMLDARTTDVKTGLRLNEILLSDSELCSKEFVVDWEEWRRILTLGRLMLAGDRYLTTLEKIKKG